MLEYQSYSHLTSFALFKFKVILAFVLISLFFTTHTWSQHLPYYQYSTEDGLCNNDIFDIAKDKSGNIWLATDNGLSRFDGQRFKNYTTSHGLSSNSLTAIGTWGDTVIVGTYKEGMQLVINNKIRPVFNTKELPFYNYCISVNKKLIAAEWSSRNTLAYENKYYDRSLKVIKIVGQPLSYSSHTDSQPFITLSENTIFLDGVKFKNLPSFFSKLGISCIEIDRNGKLWLVAKDMLFVLDEDLKIVRKLNLQATLKNDEAFSITLDNFDNVWLKTINGFGYRIDRQNSIVPINTLLKLPIGVLTRKILIDDDTQGIWIAMAGRGLFYLDKNFITNYDLEKALEANNNILAIGKDKFGKMWFGTDNELVSYTSNGFSKKVVPGLKAFNQIKTVGDKTYFIGNRISKSYKQMPLYFHNDESQLIAHFSSVSSVWQNKLYLNYNRFFRQLPNGTIEFYVNKIDVTKQKVLPNLHDAIEDWPRDIYKTNIPPNLLNFVTPQSYELFNLTENTLLLPASKVLLLVNEQKRFISVFPGSDFFIGSRIEKVIMDNPSKFYVLSDKGLGVYASGRWILQAASRNGFDLRNATTAASDADGRLWVGTKEGLTVFYNDIAFQFTKATGLPFSSINCLFYDKEKHTMWVGTGNGVAAFDINKLSETRFARPVLLIKSIGSLKKQFTAANEITLEYTDNYLSIQLITRDFVELKSANFEYSLDNQRSWQPTTYQLVLSNLQYGKHTVCLRVKTPNGGSSEIKKIHFSVQPPLYEMWYFWLILGCIGLLSFYYEFNRRKRIRGEKERVMRELSELKQRGLASMLNPHFIFNSLNSIQYFVNTGNMERANEYLSKFGRLLRLNLDAAYESSISLKDEIGFIKLYLQLESIRFQDKFTFKISVSPLLLTNEILVPTMMIQPFVENAILHGLLPLNNKLGHLEITISEVEEKKHLIIRIEDNGVGFEASKNKHDKSHTSRALDIIKKRIALLADSNTEIKASLEITDIKNTLTTSGTSVRLLLPFTFANRL